MSWPTCVVTLAYHVLAIAAIAVVQRTYYCGWCALVQVTKKQCTVLLLES